MNGLCEMMERERMHLLKLQSKLEEKNKMDIPSGTLRISSSKDYPRYYVKDENGNYTYIKKTNTGLPQMLAQKQYEQKVKKLVDKRISQLDKILKDYADEEIADLYEKEHRYRKVLIEPIEEIWEQKLQRWIEEPYERKEFQIGTAIILTEKGERVRSKSEKILADLFYHKGIVYKYEKPLKLKKGVRIYPDFTFLSKKTGKELYWEHEGRMDDPEYARMAVRKIDTYIKNGIFPGESLILTYETLNYPLQMECVEILVNKYL